MPLEIIILAAGEGKRMRSSIPKVLHPIAGKPMLERIVHTARTLEPTAIHVVYGHGGEQVQSVLADLPVHWVLQTTQSGTAHAVQQTLPYLNRDSRVLILYGDVPLLSVPTLVRLTESTAAEALGLLVANVADPVGLGRIIRDAAGKMQAIIEEKDATPTQRQIKEINTGTMLLPAEWLFNWLPVLDNQNAQGEYYLTDMIAKAVAAGYLVTTTSAHSEQEVQGVNNRVQLMQLERYYQRQYAEQLLLAGVTIFDPSRFDVRGELICQEDVTIDVNVLFEGTVTLGRQVMVGANCIIRNSVIGDGVQIHPNSIIEDAVIADNCRVGPFARIRPGTELAPHAHVGNFVEIKKSKIGQGSKVNHLSYIGDAVVGANVNIGAGTITCNYDGVNKHQTIIEDNAFIGSATQLVAPVKVGAGATIGAGSTIRKDAPAGQLSLNDTKQKTVPGWQRPRKKSEK